jgi:predicted transposase YdaD
VPPGDTGINKPFDRILKDFAEEAPALFLRLLGIVPPDVAADIQPLRPETAPAVVLPDYVAVIRTGLAEPIIFHAEFQSKYHHDLPRDMARYGGSLAWQHQMAVESVLILLRPQGVPAAIPQVGHYDIGNTRTSHPFRVVRLWEIDPTLVLETHNPRLLPWALLMKSSDEQVRGIAARVACQGDEESVGRFFTLGSVRYDRDALQEMLGGREMGMIRAILDGSSLVEEEREKAAAKGRVEGRVEGQIEGRVEGRVEGRMQGQMNEARRFLRRLLRKNFPQLESLPEIDQISNVETLESLGEAIVDTRDAEAVREAILAAASAN